MRATLRRRSTIGVATLAVAALALSGCAATEEEATSDADCSAYADYLGNEGTEVEMYTTIVSPEADLFQESFLDFEECTGITINWNGSQEFEAQLPVRVAG